MTAYISPVYFPSEHAGPDAIERAGWMYASIARENDSRTHWYN